MKTILMECPPLAELIEKFLIKYKTEECSFESDSVEARNEEQKTQDGIEDLNKAFNDCLLLADDISAEDLDDDEVLAELFEFAKPILEIVKGIKEIVPDICEIKIAKDMINIIVGVKDSGDV